MTPKEIVLGGYQSFSEGDLEGLAKIFHESALIKVIGNHKRSGEYKGFEDWKNNSNIQREKLLKNLQTYIDIVSKHVE